MHDVSIEDRRAFLGATLRGIAGAHLGNFGSLLREIAPVADRVPRDQELRSLTRATGWLNSPPLTADAVRGKVVLIDFWTYTCINWLRTLPWIRAWNARYGNHGLQVISVHSPEFSFEHDPENVRRAVEHLRVTHPIAVDSDMAIWRAFRNRYWPAIYLVDAEGRIRHHQFGEGNYDRAERVIHRLLEEAGFESRVTNAIPVGGHGVEAAADWQNLRSPETYIGYLRTENLASPGGVRAGVRHVYTTPARLRRNQWALSGDWIVGREAAVLQAPGGSIAFVFHARDLHLVMGPGAPGSRVRFQVRLDRQPPGADHGMDVDERVEGVLGLPRMYQLIRQTKPIADRRFEITFLDSGVEAFAFTFG